MDLRALSLHYLIFHHYYVHGRVDGKMVFPPPYRVRMYMAINPPLLLSHQPCMCVYIYIYIIHNHLRSGEEIIHEICIRYTRRRRC